MHRWGFAAELCRRSRTTTASGELRALLQHIAGRVRPAEAAPSGPPLALFSRRPELEAELPRVRRSRHASSTPLLSLGVGPLSVPLLPPLPPLVREAEAPAAAAAAPQPSGTAATPVQQLEAAVSQVDPGLTARLVASGERADTAFFERWLHARGSVEAAAAAIQAHAVWRTAFVGLDDTGTTGSLSAGAAGTAAAWAPAATAGAAAGLLPPLGRGISEASIADELAARKVHLQGLDTSGCPVVVVQASRCVGVWAAGRVPLVAMPLSWQLWTPLLSIDVQPAQPKSAVLHPNLDPWRLHLPQARHGAPHTGPHQAPDRVCAGQV